MATTQTKRFSSSEPDYSELINEKPKEEINHVKWIEEKERELKSTNQCLYSPSKKPFPFNKSYVYHVPLNDYTRKQIYFLYKTQPKEWTIRKLANKFKITTERVDAIIDLEEHDRKLISQGFQVNEPYVKKMESIVGASSERAREVVKEMMEFWQKRSPIFISIPEGEEITFEQAAKIAHLPFKFIDLNPDNEVSPSTQPPKVIQFDKYETNKRHTFIITDIDKNKHKSERKIIVREQDGTLREANEEEKIRESYRIWGSKCVEMMELPKTRLLRRLLSKQYPQVQ